MFLVLQNMLGMRGTEGVQLRNDVSSVIYLVKSLDWPQLSGFAIFVSRIKIGFNDCCGLICPTSNPIHYNLMCDGGKI